MAFNDIEYHVIKKQVEALVESIRPAPHIRQELDIVYRIDDQSIEIAEVRPAWQGQPGKKIENPIARITFIRSQNAWKLQWMHGTMKWVLYKTTKSLTCALNLVRIDVHGCFFG